LRQPPRQARGARRVAALLQAADAVVAEAGYEAATMCAIATRAGAAIGSLYQFFAGKDDIVEALRDRYNLEFARVWRALERDAASLAAEAFAACLIGVVIDFAQAHPAFLRLMDAPRGGGASARRKNTQDRIARVLRARSPRAPLAALRRRAAVVQQIVRGMLTLYARASARERRALVLEYRAVLTRYLAGAEPSRL
jgi:AcrR family transcriptional regulator